MNIRTTLAICAVLITIAPLRAGTRSELDRGRNPQPTAPAAPVVYTVNTTSDAIVAGACAGNLANCSLRGAITAANANVGADTINISLPAGSVINLTSALPDITEGLTINGPGADQLVVRRSSGGNYRIFRVTAGTVAFNGMTVANGRMINDQASLSLGGGIRNDGATVNITACAIIGNFSARGGGGLVNIAPGVLVVRDSTIAGNSASRQGGGGLENFGTATFINCTLTGNSATLGGAIRNFGGGCNLTNSTVVGNAATDVDTTGGGGLLNDSGSAFNVKSSIVANNLNEISPDVNGTFASAGFNLIGASDGSTGFTVSTDQKGTALSPLDPKVDPDGLKRNGGPTQTISLLTGSPAIDKGTSVGITVNLTTDQRGSARTIDNGAVTNAVGGDGTDIGAFEAGGTVSPTAEVSRKSHAGTAFDVDLAVGPTSGIEPRSGGVTNDHQLVITFPSTVTVSGNPQAQVTTGSGEVGMAGSPNGGMVAVNGNVVTIPLTNVTNAQAIMVTLFGVNDGTNASNVSVPVKLLLGDTNSDGFVNSADISQTKSKSGQIVDATSFRTDVTVNGSIDSADISLVKSKSGTALP